MFALCWFRAIGYVDKIGAVALATCPPGSWACANTSKEVSFLYRSAPSGDPPLILNFHMYLDALHERWMLAHGRSAACDGLAADTASGVQPGGTLINDEHAWQPSQCVEQIAARNHSLTYWSTCSDPAALGFQFDFATTSIVTSADKGGGENGGAGLPLLACLLSISGSCLVAGGWVLRLQEWRVRRARRFMMMQDPVTEPRLV